MAYDLIALLLALVVLLLVFRCLVPQWRGLRESWRGMKEHQAHEEFRRRKERENQHRRY